MSPKSGYALPLPDIIMCNGNELKRLYTVNYHSLCQHKVRLQLEVANMNLSHLDLGFSLCLNILGCRSYFSTFLCF